MSDTPVLDFESLQAPIEILVDRFRRLREQAPIHRLASGQYLVVSQAGVADCLRQVDNFVGTIGDVGELAEEDTLLAAIPEPRHGKIRRIVNSALAYHHCAKIEGFVRETADGYMQEALAIAAGASDRRVEMMESFARPIPSAVIAEVLGIPRGDFGRFARWSDEVLSVQTTDDSENRPLATLHPEFSAYLLDQLTRRLESDDPPDDVITRLLRTEIDGERLSTRAVHTQVMFLIVAGNETTRNLIGNLLRRMAADRELFCALEADRELVPRAVEETLRIDSPFQVTARTCTRDTTIEGHTIRRGDRVVVSITAGNLDASTYESPLEFRLDRPRPRDHVAFGAGPHLCPGAYLARMEAGIAVEALLDAVRAIRLPDDFVLDPNPIFWANGPQTLPVVLEARVPLVH